MSKGLAYALSACFIWGLIFIVPQFMTGFSAVEIALGRYFFYGIISSIIFLKSLSNGSCRYSQPIWIKGLYFSFVTTMGYYTCVVLALRYSSPSICALILGISPITIAYYGNWRQKEVQFRKLIIPSLLVIVGLVIINVPHFEVSASPAEYILGLLFGLMALSEWSWYVVANARFFKENPHVRSTDWSTLIGVCTLFWVILFAGILTIFFEKQFDMEKHLILNEELQRFLIGSAILGILCSWVGASLWNKATPYLPVSLAGQLTVFETIFGVIFVYIVSATVPSLMESIGIIILLTAVFYGIRVFSKNRTYVSEITPH